jgi:hypothetical protein
MNDSRIEFLLVSFLLLVLVAGCQPATRPLAASPSGTGTNNPPAPPAAATKVEPAAPAFRMLDAAAIGELQQAFAFDKSDAERKVAREKYKDERWRFHGRVTGHSDSIVFVQVEGLREPLMVTMESKIASERAVLHQDYQFKATVDDFFVRTFRNGIASGDPGGPSATEKDADPRKLFRYTNTNGRNFYSQHAMQGTFERSAGDVWIEKWMNGQQEWWEIRRTPEHIELSRPDGTLHLRVGKDSAPIRIGKGEWEPAFTGQWEPQP